MTTNPMRIFIIFFVLFGFFSMSDAFSKPKNKESRMYSWSQRPWMLRYFIWIDTAEWIRIEQEGGMRSNSEAPSLYRNFEPLFSLSANVPLTKKVAIGAVLIEFNRNGLVISPVRGNAKLFGKLNVLDTFMLVDQERPDDFPYLLADWFWGIHGDDGFGFSPAVCALEDTHRYKKRWRANSVEGNFGCREWTHQLYDSERPYIDVTSYEKSGTYIKRLVGWSRFDDPAKPVIGKHGKTWVCLHECPAGEKPGVIPDIKKWALKHGFPLPKRPEKQPMFPDEDFKDLWND